MSLLWSCLLLLITLHQVVVNKCSSVAPKGCCWVSVVGGGGGGDGVVVGGGVMFKVNFVSNPTTVLSLCCVVLSLG